MCFSVTDDESSGLCGFLNVIVHSASGLKHSLSKGSRFSLEKDGSAKLHVASPLSLPPSFSLSASREDSWRGAGGIKVGHCVQAAINVSLVFSDLWYLYAFCHKWYFLVEYHKVFQRKALKQWGSGAGDYKAKRKGLLVCIQISSDKFQQVRTPRTVQFHIGSWVKPVLLLLTRLILLPGGGFLWIFCQQSQNASLPGLYRAELEWGEEPLYENSPEICICSQNITQ